MTPHEWNVALDKSVGWQKVAKVVEAEGRKLLNTLPEGRYLNTAQFVETLYPAMAARGPEIDCRRRILTALMRQGPGMILADCRLRDEVNTRRMYGRVVRPWLWHRPIDKRCPHCGGVL